MVEGVEWWWRGVGCGVEGVRNGEGSVVCGVMGSGIVVVCCMCVVGVWCVV